MSGLTAEQWEYDAGQILYDEVQEIPVLSVGKPYSRADEVEVKDGVTVAEWEGNEPYPNNSPVIDCVMYGNLVVSDLDGLLHYSYPTFRLQPLRVNAEEQVIEQAKAVKGLGLCENPDCERAVVGTMKDYIEGSDGRTYCSVDCYNEVLVA